MNWLHSISLGRKAGVGVTVLGLAAAGIVTASSADAATTTITPASSSVATGKPAAFTVTTSPGTSVTIVASESAPFLGFGSNPLTVTNATGTNTQNRAGGTLGLSPYTDTTTIPADSTGVASFFVASTEVGSVSISAKADGASASASLTVASAVPTALSLVPTSQTVVTGGSVSIVAKVVDQFGGGVSGEKLSWAASGRNTKTGTVTTAADGTATITYTDAAAATSTATTDTVKVTDTTTAKVGSQTATVTFGSPVPATVAISPNPIASVPVASTATTQITAVVKNSSGAVLANQPVVFGVSSGFIGASGATATSAGATYNTTTNASGQAIAYVGSTKSGSQTITALAGTSSNITATDTATYVAGAPFAVVATGPSGAVKSGVPGTVTALVEDQFQNPVADQTVTFTSTGVGTLSSPSAVTGANGTATVQVSVPTSTTTSSTGTVTVSDAAITASGSTPSATVNYAVSGQAGTSSDASKVELFPQLKNKAGHRESVSVQVKTQSGGAAANVKLRWTVKGANSAHGSLITNASGVGVIFYNATNGGTDTITAYADLNNNGTHQANEPQITKKVSIIKVERPFLLVSSPAAHEIRIAAVTSPKISNATVHFFAVTADGAKHYIGSAKAHLGTATLLWKGRTSGVKYRVTAKVVKNTAYAQQFANSVAVSAK